MLRRPAAAYIHSCREPFCAHIHLYRARNESEVDVDTDERIYIMNRHDPNLEWEFLKFTAIDKTIHILFGNDRYAAQPFVPRCTYTAHTATFRDAIQLECFANSFIW